MTKIDIISGFLGAGKTTLIKKLLQEAFRVKRSCSSKTSLVRLALTAAF